LATSEQPLAPAELRVYAVRLGAFQKLLLSWVNRPCALTMHVRWGSGPLTVTGILRRGADGARGWALVPPDAFGGVDCFAITLLELDGKRVREVVTADSEGPLPRLRYWSHPDVMFELALLADEI
jgi:hypothetical protein